jgi:hypothetical protein
MPVNGKAETVSEISTNYRLQFEYSKEKKAALKKYCCRPLQPSLKVKGGCKALCLLTKSCLIKKKVQFEPKE